MWCLGVSKRNVEGTSVKHKWGCPEKILKDNFAFFLENRALPTLETAGLNMDVVLIVHGSHGTPGQHYLDCYLEIKGIKAGEHKKLKTRPALDLHNIFQQPHKKIRKFSQA